VVVLPYREETPLSEDINQSFESRIICSGTYVKVLYRDDC
jgi:hypothetical protein